jgi:Domain of unknown function (DUF4190)
MKINALCFTFLLFALAGTPASVRADVCAQSPCASSGQPALVSSASQSSKPDWRQRLAFKLFQKKINKAAKKAPGVAVVADEAPGATVGFVLGILSLVIPYVGFILGIIGLVMSSKALRKLKEDPSLEGKSMAKAGRICSIIGIVPGVLILTIVLILLTAGFV